MVLQERQGLLLPPAKLVFRNPLRNNRCRPNTTVHPDRIRRRLAPAANTDIISRRTLLTRVAGVEAVIPVQGRHALRLAPVALEGGVQPVGVATVDVLPSRGVAVGARGEDPGKDLAKNGPQSRKARGEDGGADLEEGPVGRLDVLPVRVLGVGRFLESLNPENGSNAGAAKVC